MTAAEVKKPKIKSVTPSPVSDLKSPEVIKAKWLAQIGGKPADFMKCDVVPLWGSHFRANLWIRDEKGPRIAKTNFITVSDDGELTLQ